MLPPTPFIRSFSCCIHWSKGSGIRLTASFLLYLKVLTSVFILQHAANKIIYLEKLLWEFYYLCKASNEQTFALFLILSPRFCSSYSWLKGTQKGKALSSISYDFTQQCAVRPSEIFPSPMPHLHHQHWPDRILILIGWIPTEWHGTWYVLPYLIIHIHDWLQRLCSTTRDPPQRIQNYKAVWQAWPPTPRTCHSLRQPPPTLSKSVWNLSMTTSLDAGLHV